MGEGDHSSLEDRPSKRHEHSMSNTQRGSERRGHGIGEGTCQMPWDNDIGEESLYLYVCGGCLCQSHAAL